MHQQAIRPAFRLCKLLYITRSYLCELAVHCRPSVGLCGAPKALVLLLLYARGALLDDDLLHDVCSVKWSTAIKLGGLVGISKLVLLAFSSSVQGQGEQARPITHLRLEVNGYSETGVDRALASTAMLLQSFMNILD